MKTTIAKDTTFVANTYARVPVVFEKGKGSIVTDENGKEYIDLGTGIGVTSFGFNDDVWTTAVKNQLDLIQHTSNLYYNKPCADLAQLICTKTGMKKVFFSNSGAEANECAIKVARRYGELKKGKECYKIVTLKNSFHGRTLATLSATGQDVFHQKFTPMPDGFLYLDANDVDGFDALTKNGDVCAIVMESVQGEGGVLPLDEKFVRGIIEIAKKEDILVIFDEVQTGNGRTGELYGYMNYGVTPDMFTTAKGLGGGLPIGACVMGDKVENVLGFGDHGSTYGGNPVACAGAITVLDRLTSEFLSEVKIKGDYIKCALQGAKGIVSVTGKGLMVGIKTEKPVKEMLDKCRDLGVICLSAKDKVRLLPALNIPMEILKKAVEIIKQVAGEQI